MSYGPCQCGSGEEVPSAGVSFKESLDVPFPAPVTYIYYSPFAISFGEESVIRKLGVKFRELERVN